MMEWIPAWGMVLSCESIPSCHFCFILLNKPHFSKISKILTILNHCRSLMQESPFDVLDEVKVTDD